MQALQIRFVARCLISVFFFSVTNVSKIFEHKTLLIYLVTTFVRNYKESVRLLPYLVKV